MVIWNVIPRKQQPGEEPEFKRMGWVRAKRNNWCVVSRGSYRRRGKKTGFCGADWEALCTRRTWALTSPGLLSSLMRLLELPISGTHLWLKTSGGQWNAGGTGLKARLCLRLLVMRRLLLVLGVGELGTRRAPWVRAPLLGDKEKFLFSPRVEMHAARCTDCAVIWAGAVTGRVLEGGQGSQWSGTSACSRLMNKVLSAAAGRITRFLNLSSGSLHCESDVLHYFKVKF